DAAPPPPAAPPAPLPVAERRPAPAPLKARLSFRKAASYPVGSNPICIAVGDGTFRPSTAYPVGASAYGVAIADVNGDGKRDVVTANCKDGSVSLLLGRGDGALSPPSKV